jgi:hypothetical protein
MVRGSILLALRLEFNRSSCGTLTFERTMNVYGESGSRDMLEAHGKIVSMAMQWQVSVCKYLKRW